MTYKLSDSPEDHRDWLINEAAICMLIDEVKRPDLVNLDQISLLVDKGLKDSTIFVVESNGLPVGVLGALLVPNTFNPDYSTLVELFWYVLPEHRKGRVGYMLVKEYTNLADMLGVDASMSLLPSSNVKDNKLERFGFEQHEVAFVRRANNGNF